MTTGPATGQETPRCHGPQGPMRGNRSELRSPRKRTALMFGRFFFFRLLMHATSTERSMHHEHAYGS